MRVETKTKDTYSYVKTGSRSFTLATAFDGKEFEGENAVDDCAAYEKKKGDEITFKNIRRVEDGDALFDTCGTWYYLKDETEVRVFIEHFKKTGKVYFDPFAPKSWVTIKYNYDNDSVEKVSIYTLDEMLKYASKLKETLDNSL